MAVDTNSTPLDKLLVVRSGVLAADIRTISDAAGFIRRLPKEYDGRLHWTLAGRSLEVADAFPDNAELLEVATLAMENALATERVLAPEINS